MGKNQKNNWLCKLGIHRPLRNYNAHFRDAVSGRMVFMTKCPCGQQWMTDSQNKWLGSKTRRRIPGQ